MSLMLAAFLPAGGVSHGHPLRRGGEGHHHPGQTRLVRGELPGGDGADPGEDTVGKQQADLLAREVSGAALGGVEGSRE